MIGRAASLFAIASATLAAVFVPISIAGGQIFLVFAMLGALVAFVGGARAIFPRDLVAPVLALVALGWAASLTSPVELSWRSYTTLRYVLFALAIPAAVSLSREPARLARRLAVLFCGAAFLASLLGLAQRSTGFDLYHAVGMRREAIRIPAPTGGGFAAIGTFNSRLTFGAMQSAALVVAVGVALAARTLVGRVGWALAALSMGAAVAASLARASFLGVAAGLVAIAAGLKRRAALVVLGAAIAAMGAGAFVPSLRARAASTLQLSANSDRAFIWGRAAEFIAEHAVLGAGIGGYPIAQAPYYDRLDPAFPMRTWAHDMPLSLLAEEGVAGLIAWVWIFLGAAVVGARALAGDGAARGLRLGALGGMAALLVIGLFHDILYDGEVAMALFFLAGLAVANAPEAGPSGAA